MNKLLSKRNFIGAAVIFGVVVIIIFAYQSGRQSNSFVNNINEENFDNNMDSDLFDDGLSATEEVVTGGAVAESKNKVELEKKNEVSAQPERNVYFNGRKLTAEDLASIKQTYGVEAEAGNYWYDSVSGGFGNVGGPALGVMYPGHTFAGQLSASASNGTSGVFINGRQLTSNEAYLVAALFGYPAPTPGRFWLDSSGNIGVEGYNVPLGNVYVAAQAASRTAGGGGGGDNFWSGGLYSAGNSNADNSQGYVSVPGYGPVGYGF